ncbi:hypothetical protein PF010_g1744 [Phytophthora fragariae]|uniref:SAM domain-containing protein n=1 Tax=Phytophthora fragariae TaxID=53985 RepID=A0A6A3UU66_9STRA|nr:hypothetical protein PF010_g1744 [Phytophthora fragariae]KAE9154223.1 hypothetical protein PF006_g1734 [Phytophthora fragariae]
MEGVAAAWSSWSCADVGRWLSDQGFQEHVELFANNKISGSILPELTRNALRDDLGIAAFGDRVRIAQAIEALIASSSPSSLPASGDASASSATSTTSTSNAQPQAWLPRDENALDLVVLHAAPLVIKDSRHRIYPMEKLDLEAERREISNSLLTDVQHKAIHVRFDIATADILRSLMTAWKCTVLHFSGHGLGQRAALCFEDGAGCTHLITPDALRQLMFSGHPPGERQVPGVARDAAAGPKPLDGNVKLVFVNACHSQKVASVFLNAGIPHVVAVHSDSLVVDASATMFAKHFYLSLFHGHTVSTAFEIAKGAVRALPTQKRAACCCAHLHEPTCTWMRDGSRHSQHSATQCCCKGHVLAFPHDESSKFLLLGSAPHDVVLFGDIPNGSLRDYTPRYPSNIPSMHGQFIGRNTETYLMVKSLRENAVTACLGAPGIGKSSLIISVAHFVHSRRMFPDGVFYVDLEGQKLSTVRYAIAQSIGMPAADTDEEVFAELGTKNCLLVLDKVEELLDEDENKGEELLHQLISVAPNLKLLLASRRNMHIPSVTPYSLSISELPLHTATELLCLVAPGCSAKLAERLARICGCLPLAIRVVGRALANARMTVTPERMIEYLERDEHRFETIRELNQVGHKECVDRCIRSSFCHLDEPLRLAFMALGFFRGSFEIEAAEAVLSSMLTEQNAAGKLVGSSSYSLMSSALSGSVGATTSTSSSSNATYFPADAYAKSNRSRSRDDDVSSVRSLGSQLSNMDGFGFDNDGAMTNDSYDLLDLESSEEVKAREVSVPSASVALELLHQWSLVEFDTKTNRYRMHNLVQLFAEEEAGRMGEECFADRGPASMSGSVSSSFVAASMGAPTMSISLGKELLLTWKRRFVRYYCMIVAKASHAYRFEGTLALFDKERANIESAMRLAHELTLQSIEQVRESNCRVQQEIVSDQIGEVPTSSTSTMRSKSEPAFFTGDGALPTPTIESHRSSSAISTSNSSSSGGVGSGQRSAGSAGLSNSTIVDALLYSNLVVAQSLNNLALYLSNQLETQNLSEAELATQRAEIGRLYERALRIRRSRLGNASFETAATLNNMGNFKRLTKDWHGAEENIKEALQITDRYFNDISPRAARIFINLARVYRDQKRYGEAIAAYKKAQDIRQQLFPDTRDVGFCIEQIGKCLRLQGKEEEGKVLEERGRQMKKLGLSALEQDELGEVDSGSTISGGSNGFQHAILSGDNVEGGISSSHLFARVNVYDIVDAEALISRKFNFPGKLLGERGIHLKKIEAIACAQLRYFGPWPQSLTKWSKGSQRGGSSCTMPEAYIQITSTNEAALERAKEQSVQLLREMKLSWERITAEVVAGGVAAEEADICICIGLHRPSYRDQIALVAPLMLTYGDARHEEVG